MTFSYRFVHACCIHTHIVDNDTAGKQVFRDKNQAFQCAKEDFKCRNAFETVLKLSVQLNLDCEFATWS
jgi:hypothetical protein